MKNIFQILTATIISVGFMGSVASAADCNAVIGNTGEESNNEIVCVEKENVVVTCKNNIYVGSVNDQNSTTGDGTVKYNTTTGEVVTGEAVNYNGQNVVIGASCAAAASADVCSNGQPGPNCNEGQPGMGGAGGQPTTPGAGGIGALPNTSNITALPAILGSLVIAAATAAISWFAYRAYRHADAK